MGSQAGFTDVWGRNTFSGIDAGPEKGPGNGPGEPSGAIAPDVANRKIYFSGSINAMSALQLCTTLRKFAEMDPRKPIHLMIDSPGGSVTSTLAIYDTMMSLPCEVWTYTEGVAASGGSVLFVAGAKGHRYMQPHAQVMIHQLRGGREGTYTDMNISKALEDNMMERLEKIYLKHSSLTIGKIRDMLYKGDYWLTRQDAIDHGICDGGYPGIDESRGSVPNDRLHEPPKASELRKVKAESKVVRERAKVTPPAVTPPAKQSKGKGLT